MNFIKSFLVAVVITSSVGMIKAKADDAVIVGPHYSNCGKKIVAGGFAVTCNLQGLSVLDFRNKIQIGCFGQGATFGTWTKTGPQPPYGLTCYRTPLSTSIPSANVHLEQRSVLPDPSSAASLFFDYDPTTQTLNVCVIPVVSAFSVEALCFPAKVQAPPQN